jgi:hypothetical protein
MSNRIKYILYLVILLLCGGVQADAQPHNGGWRHEMSATAAWAVTGLLFPEWDGVAVQPLNGYHIGMDYTGYWSDWGIEAGASFHTFNNSLEFPGYLQVTTKELLPAGEWEEYTVITQQYRETQRLGMLSLHVAVRYLLPITSIYAYYFSGGVRFSLPVSATYDAAAAMITATASAPRYDWTGAGAWDASAAYSLRAETGFRWSISERLFIESGLVVNYGVMPGRHNNTRNDILPYNTGEDYPASRSLLDFPAFSGSIVLLSYGIKIRIGWSAKAPWSSGKKYRYLWGIFEEKH